MNGAACRVLWFPRRSQSLGAPPFTCTERAWSVTDASTAVPTQELAFAAGGGPQQYSGMKGRLVPTDHGIR